MQQLGIEHEVPDAIVALGAGRLVCAWNAGAERIYGFSAAEALGKTLEDLTAPPEQPDPQYGKIWDGDQPSIATYEAVRRRKDGLLVYADITVRMIPGTAPIMVLCEKDVTDLKIRRDAKLLESRFRELFELMPDAIIMLNVTGRIVLANHQAERLFGYAEGSLLGQPVEVLLPQKLRRAHLVHRAGYGAQPRVRSMGVGLDLYGLRYDGSEFPVEISLSPLQMPEGMMVLSAIRDSTERRRFETTLKEKNELLASAMQAKDRFLANMSHELRTPLNAILGFTGTLLMKLPGALNPEQEKQLKIVQKSGQHLLSLINDLLDLARVDAAKLELHPENLSAQEVLQDINSTLRLQAEQKGLVFTLDMPPNDLKLTTDRRALTQILTNLTANAIKFCDKGRVELALRQTERDGRNQVQFVVSDTGIGIRAEHLPFIFNAFARFDTDLGPREGSGLGLHLSRRLAEQLAGEIDLVSEYGKGSVFTLTLPGA